MQPLVTCIDLCTEIAAIRLLRRLEKVKPLLLLDVTGQTWLKIECIPNHGSTSLRSILVNLPSIGTRALAHFGRKSGRRIHPWFLNVLCILGFSVPVNDQIALVMRSLAGSVELPGVQTTRMDKRRTNEARFMLPASFALVHIILALRCGEQKVANSGLTQIVHSFKNNTSTISVRRL